MFVAQQRFWGRAYDGLIGNEAPRAKRERKGNARQILHRQEAPARRGRRIVLVLQLLLVRAPDAALLGP